MLKICLVFWKSEPQYAYKSYAYKRKNMVIRLLIPRLIFFSKFRLRHFFYFIDLQLNAKLQKILMNSL